jgi:hypothetical protein
MSDVLHFRTTEKCSDCSVSSTRKEVGKASVFLLGSTLCTRGRSGVVRLSQFFIEKLVHLFDERHEFVVILFGCDLSSQVSQVFSINIFRCRLHGAFPQPVAERPVFGFCRCGRALQIVVPTSHLGIQCRPKQLLSCIVHGCGPLSGRAHVKLHTGFRRLLYSVYRMPGMSSCTTKGPLTDEARWRARCYCLCR